MSMDSVAHSKAVLTINESGLTAAEDKKDREQELKEIKEFEDQDPMVKWALRGLALFLLCTLAFLWIYYR